MRKLLRPTILLALLGLIATLTGLAAAYRAAHKVPDFYQAALEQEPAKRAEAGDALERGVLNLHNDVRQQGRWQAIFTDHQINGWLATDLPEKFPKVLPRGVKDPRIVIEQQQALIACRYETKKISTVVSLGLEIQLTDEPNVVAVRVQQARAGVLPLPLKNFLDQITAVAKKADVPVRWLQTDGDPVALVTIPSRHEDYKYREIFLDSIELRDGKVFLSGCTEQVPPVRTVADAGPALAPADRLGQADPTAENPVQVRKPLSYVAFEQLLVPAALPTTSMPVWNTTTWR